MKLSGTSSVSFYQIQTGFTGFDALKTESRLSYSQTSLITANSLMIPMVTTDFCLLPHPTLLFFKHKPWLFASTRSKVIIQVEKTNQKTCKCQSLTGFLPSWSAALPVCHAKHMRQVLFQHEQLTLTCCKHPKHPFSLRYTIHLLEMQSQ